MSVNWRVRMRNKAFWATAIPTVFLLVRAVAAVFNLDLDTTPLAERTLAVLDPAFVLCALLGVIADPTTAGFDDSERALAYTYPAEGPVPEIDLIDGTNGLQPEDPTEQPPQHPTAAEVDSDG